MAHPCVLSISLGFCRGDGPEQAVESFRALLGAAVRFVVEESLRSPSIAMDKAGKKKGGSETGSTPKGKLNADEDKEDADDDYMEGGEVNGRVSDDDDDGAHGERHA